MKLKIPILLFFLVLPWILFAQKNEQSSYENSHKIHPEIQGMLEKGFMQKALLTAESHLNNNPQEVINYWTLAHVYQIIYKRQHHDIKYLNKAEGLLNDVKIQYPKQSECYWKLGNMYLDFPEAFKIPPQEIEKLFTIALNLNPHAMQAYEGLILTLQFRLRDSDRAETLLRQYQDKFSDNPSSNLFLSDYFNLKGQVLEAVQILEKSLADHPEYLPITLKIWDLYLKVGNFKAIQNLYAEGKKRWPDVAYFDFRKGLLMAKTGNKDQAFTDFKVAIMLDPDFVKAYVALEAITKVEEKYHLGDMYNYSQSKILDNAYRKVSVDQKEGLLDMSGMLMVPIQFDSLEVLKKKFVGTFSKDRKGLYSIDGIKILPPIFHEFTFTQSGLILARNGNYWGCWNSDGKNIAAVNYIQIREVVQGELIQLMCITENGDREMIKLK